jgi:hypothetical protein
MTDASAPDSETVQTNERAGSREQDESEETGLTWENWLLVRLPRSPLQVAGCVLAPLVAYYLGAQWVLGYPPERDAFVLCLFVAYSLAVNTYLTGPVSPPFETLPRAGQARARDPLYLRLPRSMIRRSRLPALVGLAGAVSLIQFLAYEAGDPWLAPWTTLRAATTVLPILLLLGWLMGRFAHFSLTGAGRWSEVSGPRVDLLNLAPAYAAGRIGLRTALVWIIGVAIFSLFFLHMGLWFVAVLVVLGLAVGVAALLIPVQGVRRQIREAKRAELARLREELHSLRDGAMNGTTQSPGRMADLLAYETRVQAISEWPFDVPTLRRFGLYLLIPLGSMIGGAFVERVVDAFFPS